MRRDEPDPLPDRFNLAQYCLEASARRHPEKTALILAGGPAGAASRWTYAMIEDRVLRMAEGLRGLGLARGERLFIRMGNSLDFALAFFAASAAGLVPVPASPMLTVAEVDALLRDCGARAVATDGEHPLPDLPRDVRVIGKRQMDQLVLSARGSYAPTGKDDPAYLVYTSGTAGRPKGVLHAQRAVWGRRPMYRDWYDIRAGDIVLHTGSLNWTYTLGSGLCDPWANGATAVIYVGARDVAAWPRLVAEHQATLMASVPGLYRQILKYTDVGPRSLPTLRHGLVAGEALSPALAAAWRERTGTVLYEAFGMSEISTYISSSPAVPPRAGSPGKPQRGRRVAILPVEGGETPVTPGETGLIGVDRADPGLMLGYWNRPEEERAAFRGRWFVGGDLGRMDPDGYVWFEGRADDLMNAMGYRVSPQEVEAVFAALPGVAEVGVAEVPARDDIRIMVAFVVPAEGARCQPDELLRHAAERLAAYKLPREVRLVSALPRTPNGKLMRRQFASLTTEGAP